MRIVVDVPEENSRDELDSEGDMQSYPVSPSPNRFDGAAFFGSTEHVWYVAAEKFYKST